mmetsp:Transcript_1031/g.3353  ORF Transcript_1031/g.3353 Transcript_1031/m.3353 type:complete len:515 (-) Transcript_1031:131-1675(-)
MILKHHGNVVVIQHSDKRVLGACLVCIAAAALFLLLDLVHPRASLQCVRHELVEPLDQSRWRLHAGQGATAALKGEDNDCELLVRRWRWQQQRPGDRPLRRTRKEGRAKRSSGEDGWRWKDTLLGVFGMEESMDSFEIESVALLREPELSEPLMSASRHHSLGSRHHHDRQSGRAAAAAFTPTNAPQHGAPPLRSESKRALLVLRDQMGRNYTFYTFSSNEYPDALRLTGAIQQYLHRAGRARSTVRLKLLWDTSKWEEYALLISIVVLAFLATRPYLETIRFDGPATVFVLRQHTFFMWPSLHLAASLDAISRMEMVEEKVLQLRAGGRLGRFSALRSRSEYSLRLYLRKTGMEPRFLRCHASSEAPTSGQESRGPATVRAFPVAFGYQTSDPALLKRIVELVSGLLLDQESDHSAPWQSGSETQFVSATTVSNRNLPRAAATGTNGSHSRAPPAPAVAVPDRNGRCIICLGSRARVVFFPCKHLCVCRQCAEECEICPICRSPIHDRHAVYI